MKKNRLRIVQIIAITTASIIWISSAAFGVSAAEPKDDIQYKDNTFTDNYFIPDNNDAINMNARW